MAIADKLKEARAAIGLTQQQVADKLGITKATYSGYEIGRREPDVVKIRALAQILNVSGNWLLETGMESMLDDDPPTNAIPDYPGIIPVRRKRVPLLGTIAAGEPIYADETRGIYVACDDDIACDFALRLQGDSMIDAHIYDGDIVLIREQSDVDDGTIAAVLYEDSATLKYLYHLPDGVTLSPANRAYPPQTHTGDDASAVRVLGLAVAVVHKLYTHPI